MYAKSDHKTELSDFTKKRNCPPPKARYPPPPPPESYTTQKMWNNNNYLLSFFMSFCLKMSMKIVLTCDYPQEVPPQKVLLGGPF